MVSCVLCLSIAKAHQVIDKKIYVNGTEITSFLHQVMFHKNQDSPINTSGHAVKIGCFGNFC
ncbi:MAG: hypothetical protein CM15mV61_140 [uncultured marine virus]|nr:MAG: hypothetical protein CM15mV61_140 [uncultured marine virus]